MTQNSDEVKRLIADVEAMNSSQRLVFLETLMRSFKEHELFTVLPKMQQAVGMAHGVTSVLAKNVPKGE